jgi:kynurenine 3-monooxygenase
VRTQKPVTTTIIGAGLVGSLLSIYLSRKGYDVEIFEKRADLRAKKNLLVGEGRSINLAISTRGLHALDKVGLKEEVLKFAIPMRGRMVHGLNGELTYQPYGPGDSDAINSISRGWLNGFLLDQAETARNIQIHFQKELTGVDFSARQLKFSDQTSSVYGCLIGTDGSASPIRRQMVQDGHTEMTSDELSHSYKEFVMAPKESDQHAMEKNALHIWPRGDHMMIALPNYDGSFTCTLFLRTNGEFSFAALTSPDKVRRYFAEEYRDFSALVPDYVEQFFSHPIGKMYTVKTTHWTPLTFDKEVLLIGDAAHAIVPFFGQGMNCGFEDCEALVDHWEEWIERGFLSYSQERKPNTDAIADMAVENFIEMSAKVADPHFLLQKAVEKKLQTAFPTQYVSRYSLVSFSRVPYKVAKQVGEIQSGILDRLCDGKKSPDDVSMDLAETLIRDRLDTVMKREVLPALS